MRKESLLSAPTRKALLAVAAGALVLAVAGCAPQTAPAGAPESSPTTGSGETAEQELVVGGTISPESIVVAGDKYTPEVRVAPSGALIQRTPSEIVESGENDTSVYQKPIHAVPSNTFYLKADSRGCNACHEDLAATVNAMEYQHFDLSNTMGLEADVRQCTECHGVDEAGVFNVSGEFGAMIHGIHEGTAADCWNCHYAADNTGEMVLWDEVKHQMMRGFTDISNEELANNFAYRTDEVAPAGDGMFDVLWQSGQACWDRARNIESDAARDTSIYDEWTITVTGEVDQEKTWTLSELIAQAPSETFNMKKICVVNPSNGSLVGQAEYTGIPLQWFLDQVNIKSGAQCVSILGADFGSPNLPLADFDGGKKGYLVYEMNGEPLSWHEGWPCSFMTGGYGASVDTKEVSEILITADPSDTSFNIGMIEEVKPSVGIFNLNEGQMIQTGQPFTFHGYAESFDERVAAVEISMDRGATWQRFETPDATTDNWVTWTYDFTPQADGAYCFAVRGVTDEGSVTQNYVEKMVVATSDMPEKN